MLKSELDLQGAVGGGGGGERRVDSYLGWRWGRVCYTYPLQLFCTSLSRRQRKPNLFASNQHYFSHTIMQQLFIISVCAWLLMLPCFVAVVSVDKNH